MESDYPELFKVEEAVPIPNQRVLVVTEKFQLWGYITREGIWRDDSKNAQIKNVIAWHPILSSDRVKPKPPR